MFRTTIRRLALAGAALSVAALPVAALVPPQGDRIDLGRYDAITRVGNAQLPTDPYCAAPSTLAADLGEAYGEDIRLTAARDGGRMFQVWASDEAGTWTVSYTRPDGVACVIGSGTGWTGDSDATVRLQEVGLEV